MSFGPVHAIAWRLRYYLAAFLLLAIVAAVMNSISRLEPETRPIAALTRSLPAGHTLERSDIQIRQIATELIPSGVVTSPVEAVGHQLVASLPKGMPLTRGVLLTSDFLEDAPPGHAIVPIELNDAAAALLSPGVTVSLYALAQDDEGPIDSIADSAVIVGVGEVEAEPSAFSETRDARIFYVSIPTARVGEVIAANAQGLYAALMPPQ